jgi:hypothetical protein
MNLQRGLVLPQRIAELVADEPSGTAGEEGSYMQRPPQSRQSRKGEQLALFSAVSQLWELFLRVGDCENQGGTDRVTNGRRCDPTAQFWKRTQRANFFHGSTTVRTSVLGASFTEISGYLLSNLRFGCDNQKHV